MSSPATNAGTAKRKGIATPAASQVPAKKPKTKRKSPRAEASFLATVKAENPNITSEEFAFQFRVPIDEVVRMRHFLGEYLKDFDEKLAAVRMGYPYDSALGTGRLLLHHSYSQLKLLEMLEAMEIPKLISAQLIISRLWKEANNGDGLFNNAPNRIAALGKLAKIIGLENPKPIEEKNIRPSGGIMFVPIALSSDDWGDYAHASQKALKDSTAIDV